MMVKWGGRNYIMPQDAAEMLGRLYQCHEKIDQTRDQVIESEVRRQIAAERRLDLRVESLRDLHTTQAVGGPNDGAT